MSINQLQSQTGETGEFGGIFPLLLRIGSTPEEKDARFYELVKNNPELVWEQTAEGDVLMMLPTGGNSSRRNSKLTMRLGLWAEGFGGQAFDSSTLFKLPNGAKRGPDSAWIEQSRWDSLTDEDRESYPPIVPDFVIELRSKSDRLAALQAKMDEYIANGVRLVWLIDPIGRKVFVYRQGLPTEQLDNPQSLEGEDVLPGFVLDLNDIL